MKVIKYFFIIIISLFLIYNLFLFFDTKKNFISKFEITNIKSDTTFLFQKYSNSLSILRKGTTSNMGIPFSIKAVGSLDNYTEVYVKYIEHNEKFYVCTLPKGKIDTTWNGELYDDRAEIVFLHKKAKTGKLKLIFKLGSE